MRKESLRFPPDYSEIHQLDDGTSVRFRLLRPSDREALVAGFQEMSPESRYRRFFSAMPRLPETVLHDLLATDGWNHLAIVASTVPDGHGVGIGRFIRLKEDATTAEAAVAVIDAMQGKGVGKLLLARLTEAARERDITHFQAQVLTGNDAMVALLHDVDADAVRHVDGGVSTYLLDLPEPTPEGFGTGALFDMLRAAGRGLQVLLSQLQHFPE